MIKKSLVCFLIKQDEKCPNAIIRNFALIMRKHYIILLLSALLFSACGNREAAKTLAAVGAYINRCKELVNSAISDVYSRSHNSPQELKNALDALKYGRRAGDSVGIWSITGHLAACYANMYMWDDAERTYNDFFSMTVYDSLTYYRRKVNHAKAILQGPQPNAKRCIGILEEAAGHNLLSMEGYCLFPLDCLATVS